MQCITNGVNYEKLKDGSGIGVKRLEMFFSGFPEIVGMSYFPNLVTLCIVGQDTLEKIEGLESLIHLEELWICEANVQVSYFLDLLVVTLCRVNLDLFSSLLFAMDNSHWQEE